MNENAALNYKGNVWTSVGFGKATMAWSKPLIIASETECCLPWVALSADLDIYHLAYHGWAVTLLPRVIQANLYTTVS